MISWSNWLCFSLYRCLLFWVLVLLLHQPLYQTSHYFHSSCEISSLVLTTSIGFVTYGSLWGTKIRSMCWTSILKRSFLMMLHKKKQLNMKASQSLYWRLVSNVGNHVFWTPKELLEHWGIPNEWSAQGHVPIRSLAWEILCDAINYRLPATCGWFCKYTCSKAKRLW